MSEAIMGFGPQIKARREALGFTLRDVEAITNGEVSNSYLSQLENGKIRSPSAHIVLQLCAAYAVSHDDMLAWLGLPASIVPPRICNSCGQALPRNAPLQEGVDYEIDNPAPEPTDPAEPPACGMCGGEKRIAVTTPADAPNAGWAACPKCSVDPAGVSEMADWWKPNPGDPFWMLEAPDGEWLANQHSLLGTRDAAKAIRFPSENHARNHEARMKAGTKWWDATPTEHKWIEPTARTPSPVLEVAKEALEPFAAADRWFAEDEDDSYSPPWAEFFKIVDFRRARAALQTINEQIK